MDRDWTAAQGVGENGRQAQASAFVLPSRARALAACEAALEQSAAFLLLTGEPGIGKTWLWRLLAERDRKARYWLGIDPAPTAGAEGLGGDLAAALGLNLLGTAADWRSVVAGHLEEQWAEGRRWVAVIDEAQGLSDEQLEAVRLLSNRLGQPDGFAALVLAGQTRLARRLAAHELAPLEARLTARVHLRPIDADEAGDLLDHESPTRSWSLPEVEALHRDSGGNPGRILRLAGRRRSTVRHLRWLGEAPQPARGPILSAAGVSSKMTNETFAPEVDLASELEIEPRPDSIEEPHSDATVDVVPVRAEPLLGATRPPIVDEEGLIEVGWVPPETVEPPSASPDVEPAAIARGAATNQLAAEPAEEPLNDHYAALAAWNEWARNQGRRTSGSDREPAGPEFDDRPEEELRADGLPPGSSHVWAEGPDSFAPYSQLFSRLRPSKDPD